MSEQGTTKDQIHTMPEDDLRRHEISPQCWCKPRQDDEEPALWIHNSLDGRESYEQGRKLQ